MSSRTKLLLDEIEQLPAWAQKMARKYYAGEASHFLLYNNIYDLVRSGSEYIKFGSTEAERAFAALMRVSDPLAGRDAMRSLPKDPARALPLIEHFLLYGDQVAVIINFLDTIIPAGDVSYMGGEDRTNLVAFQRWITSSRLLKKDNIVILVAESVAEVHPRIRQNSRLAAIEIPYPDDSERLEFIAQTRAQL